MQHLLAAATVVSVGDPRGDASDVSYEVVLESTASHADSYVDSTLQLTYLRDISIETTSDIGPVPR